ncbi:MAG: hypothetical protein HXN33_02050 [Prevotella histicola]|uniref:Uncharacterized protein n=1 Tax=Prevotella histicola TaxID=470565 RepID=A0A930HWU1_9BACT|nr:hypothetical protein [Prevotella histicola]
MVYLIISSVVLSVAMAIVAAKKAKELPDSVSSFSYYVGDVRFSLWATTMAAVLLFSSLHALPPKQGYIAGLMSIGLLMVAASPCYRTENKILHYVGGYLFGLTSQVVVALLMPWLLILWVLFPLVFIRKDWKENATFIAEAICYLTLVVSLIVSLLA